MNHNLPSISVGSTVWAIGDDGFDPMIVESLENGDGWTAIAGRDRSGRRIIHTIDSATSSQVCCGPARWEEVSPYDYVEVVVLDGPSTVVSALACIGDREQDNVRFDLLAAGEHGRVDNIHAWLLDRNPDRVEIPPGHEGVFGMLRAYVVQPYVNAYDGRNSFTTVEYRMGRHYGWNAVGKIRPLSESETDEAHKREADVARLRQQRQAASNERQARSPRLRRR